MKGSGYAKRFVNLRDFMRYQRLLLHTPRYQTNSAEQLYPGRPS